uniref:26S proteasome non-ATPase regulatory subunit 8 n=1 Tax=Globodera rostochiensis TaxID=31243 RepID=A0A914I1P5_GLORO
MQDDIEKVHAQLLSAWEKSNTETVKGCLNKLQVCMFRSGVVPGDQLRILTIFKDYYEIRALSYVLENNMDDFEQAIKDVLQFYANCGGDATDLRVDVKFQKRYLMYGLFLMYLLASNKLAEFRMLIEQIDHGVRLQDPYLDVPVKLERYLSCGSYNKMFLTEKNLPSKYYIPFINILKQAVQNEISLGLEKAYRSIPIADAAKQLIMSNAEVLAFGTRRGWLHKGDSFLIGKASTTIATAAEGSKQKAKLAMANGVERELHPLESRQIVAQCLKYAIQLDRII